MRKSAALLSVLGILAFFPSAAHAQKLPWIILPLLASPLVALLLAAGLGIAAGSWTVAFRNMALVVFWVVWFLAASEFPAPDPVIWASLVALALHLLIMLWRIVRLAVLRARSRAAS